jgi:hypothetical protein
LLPNGKVLASGGYDGTNYLSSVEWYDPPSGMWTVGGTLNTPRSEHTSVLLPDGNLLIAGGLNNNGPVTNAELYAIGPAFTNSWRPRIVSLVSPLALGGSLVITGAQFRGFAEDSSGNTQDSPTDYPLVQLRSLGNGQIQYLSATNWSTNSFASAPVWGFPPGNALATVFVNGIQSTSSIVNISVPVPTTPKIASARAANGLFQFFFTNSVGASFGVLTSTNLATPLINWTTVSGVVEASPGQFQFTDSQPTNRQRFYRLFEP